MNECNLLHHPTSPCWQETEEKSGNYGRLGPQLAHHMRHTGNENNDADIDWSMSDFESNSFVVYSFNCMSIKYLISYGLEILCIPSKVSKTNVRCFFLCFASFGAQLTFTFHFKI